MVNYHFIDRDGKELGRMREREVAGGKKKDCDCPPNHGGTKAGWPCSGSGCYPLTGGGKVTDGGGREDVMRKKKRMKSASNAIGNLKEYTKNRTNIERFLSEEKGEGKPTSKEVMNMVKKVITKPPTVTPLASYWCCLVNHPDNCCKPPKGKDRWWVIMHPWG